MSDLDRDLRSIHDARTLARAAARAQRELESFSQEQVDALIEAMAAAGLRESDRLARMAVEETGYGKVADKIAKNDFVLRDVVAAMRPMRTVGVIAEDRERRIKEIAEPVGVVAGIIPTTNPTSTAMFKCLIAIKARCGIVLSPHPNAKACIKATADVMAEAAQAAGAPVGIIGCMTVVSMEGTQELMRGRDTDVILATGGMGLVKAAYSAGKPAYGVGPGNVPAYVHRSADVEAAVRDIVDGTTFDNGTLCSSEQAVVCDRAVGDRVREALRAEGGHLLVEEECRRLAQVLITPELLVDPRLVGQSAETVAAAAGIEVPAGTRVLVCPQTGVGPEHPLSHEKLSPVLALYEVEDWREGCERCTQLLRFGGLGHTLVIHAQDEEVILEFGLHKPAHRVLVNTVASVGAVGLTTDLFPSMTLGCGSWGNNVTSDNVGPQHLINVKRLAWGVRPYRSARTNPARSDRSPAAAGRSSRSAPDTAGRRLPPGGDQLESRVAAFLADRGIIAASSQPSSDGHDDDCGCGTCGPPARVAPSERGAHVPASRPEAGRGPSSDGEAKKDPPRPLPVDFVAEDDVRRALQRGERIVIGSRTLITPLARDLGEQHGIFDKR